jgi:hypothetical protein
MYNKNREDVTNMKETEKRKETSNKPDDSKKKKQKWFIIIICFVLIAGVAEFGYLSSQSKKKEEAQKTAFDNVAVEVKDDYAETIPLTSEEKILKTKDLVEILKDGKADKNTKITKVSKDTIDTSKEGGYIITYTIETIDSLGNKATKDYKKTFTVTNTDEVAPVIKLNKDTVEITEGDAYDPSGNIKSVKDDFDGNITKADKKPDEAGTAYYLIDFSKLDTSKAGEYKVKVTAADKAGNEATKEFTVKVKAKKEDKSSSNGSTNSNSGSGKNNSTSGSKNNTGSSSKNNGTSNSNKGNTPSGSNNSGTSGSSSNNKPQQNCTTVWVQDSAAWDETVVDQAAWDETVTTRVGDIVVCNGCGQEFNSYEEWDKHAGSFASQGDWSHGGYHVDGRYSTSVVHHDAITHVVHHEATGHYEQRCS